MTGPLAGTCLTCVLALSLAGAGWKGPFVG